LERQQPKKRRKFGVLEHKKDYIRRAKDYHAKETRIKRLKEMAALRNPEEFHMGMINTLAVQKGEARRRAELRLAKSLRSGGSQKLAQTQDAAYVTARIQTEQKAIDRLKASLQLLEDEDDLVPTASTSTTAPGAFDVSDSGSGSGDNDALAALPSHVRNHLYKAKAKKPAATSTLGLLAITGAKAKAKAKSKSKKKKGKKKKKDKSKSKNKSKSKKGKKRKRTSTRKTQRWRRR